MRRLSDMNPTARGLLIVAAIAAIIVAFSLGSALKWVFLLINVLFLVAFALFVYRWWLRNRHEISLWQTRPRVTFYAAGVVMAADLIAFLFLRASGRNEAAFFVVLLFAGFAMWRVWRDERTYS